MSNNRPHFHLQNASYDITFANPYAIAIVWYPTFTPNTVLTMIVLHLILFYISAADLTDSFLSVQTATLL